jgi:hypothetical protein
MSDELEMMHRGVAYPPVLFVESVSCFYRIARPIIQRYNSHVLISSVEECDK